MEKEHEEVYDAETNTRRQEETGGVIVTFVFDVGGEEVEVKRKVTAAQLASVTYAQALDICATDLATKLGV